MRNHPSTGTKQDQTGVIGTSFFNSPRSFDQIRPDSSKFDFIFNHPPESTEFLPYEQQSSRLRPVRPKIHQSTNPPIQNVAPDPTSGQAWSNHFDPSQSSS